jgi:RNA polymerase sigma-70 factor (ECF subfamily)
MTARPSRGGPQEPGGPEDPTGVPLPEPEGTPGGEAEVDPDREAEHALIRRAQAGEEGAFEALVRGHQRLAFGIAKSLVASEEDARDLAQEAFLRVFRNLERFDFEHPFATWLHRIVTNLAIDHLRKRRLVLSGGRADDGDEPPEHDIADEDQPAPSDRLEALETALQVRQVIESLAPHFQTVLVLRELQGLPCTEIAEIVGATHVTVRWRLHRGRKLFQEEWERRQRALQHPAESSRSAPATNSGGGPP